MAIEFRGNWKSWGYIIQEKKTQHGSQLFFFFLGPFSKAGYILLLSQQTGMLHKSRQTNLLQDIFTFSFLLTFSRSLFAVKDNVTFCYFSTINFQP